jgi:hypothetical protein
MITTNKVKRIKKKEIVCKKKGLKKYLYFIIEFSFPCIQSVKGGGMTPCNHAELFNKITTTI